MTIGDSNSPFLIELFEARYVMATGMVLEGSRESLSLDWQRKDWTTRA
jgi:hypothetical protein